MRTGTSKITRARLASQLLEAPASPAEVVAHFGALQGQDLPGALLSLALRTPERSLDVVRDAFNGGQLVRGWNQRGTIHVLGAERYRDLMALAWERAPSYLSSRGVTIEMVDRARDIALAMMTPDGLTRAELTAAWKADGLVTEEIPNRWYILPLTLDGTLVLGPLKGREQVLVVTDEWIEKTEPMSREDLVADIVRRYVASHAPTSREALAWWTGLPKSWLNRALADLGMSEDEDGFLGAYDAAVGARSLYLLPPYDEFMLGYHDRNISIPEGFEKSIHNGYGIFTGSIVYGGQTIGTWRRKGSVVEPSFFAPVSTALEARVRLAGEQLPR